MLLSIVTLAVVINLLRGNTDIVAVAVKLKRTTNFVGTSNKKLNLDNRPNICFLCDHPESWLPDFSH